MFKQWFWFITSIILNGLWFLIDLINPWDENDDGWYVNNFGLNDPFMHKEAWPDLQKKKSTHTIKKIAKDWLVIPENSRVQGKRALRFLCALIVWPLIFVILF